MKNNRLNKNKLWENLIQKTLDTRDGLGKSLDEGIKETVVAFWTNGFATRQSCEGHLDWGEAGPWVDIEPPKFNEEMFQKVDEAFQKAEKAAQSNKNIKEVNRLFNEAHRLQDEAKRPVLEEAQKVAALLEEFYLGRIVPHGRMLILDPFASFVRLQTQGTFLQKIASEEVKEQKLKEYQDEMKEFTQFLKNKFFQN